MCKGVTDEGLSPVFTKHRDLQKVDISHCNDVTCASIVHLTSSCASLVSLKMAMCSQLSAEAFVAMGQHCQLLEELDVSDCRINDEGSKSFSFHESKTLKTTNEKVSFFFSPLIQHIQVQA